jgi:hypothetical protein
VPLLKDTRSTPVHSYLPWTEAEIAEVAESVEGTSQIRAFRELQTYPP